MRNVILFIWALLWLSCKDNRKPQKHNEKPLVSGKELKYTYNPRKIRDSLLKLRFPSSLMSGTLNASSLINPFPGSSANAVVPTSEDLLGFGYNSSTQTPAALLIDISKSTIDRASKKGQFVDKTFDHITSLSQFYDKLGLDIRASAKFGGFKGSAAYSLAQSVDINNFSDYLLVRVVVRNSPETIKSAVLSKDALWLANNRKDLFRERYGNEFFYSKITGGEFYCLFQFTSNSNDAKKQVNAVINAAYKSFVSNFSLSAAMTTVTNSLNKNTRTTFQLIRNGDSGELIDSTITAISKYADVFPEKVKSSKNIVVINMGSKSIIYAKNPGNLKASDFEPIRKQKYFLDKVSVLATKIRSANANYSFAIDPENEELFDKKDVEPLQGYLEQNEKSLVKLSEFYEGCEASYKGCDIDLDKKISYESKSIKSIYSPSNPSRVDSKSMLLSDDPGLREQEFITISYNRVATIAVKGTWRLRAYPQPGDENYYFPDPACDVPWEERPPKPNPPITKSAVLVITRDITDGSLVQQYILNKDVPITISGGVKVFVRPQYPVQNCNPPAYVEAY